MSANVYVFQKPLWMTCHVFFTRCARSWVCQLFCCLKGERHQRSTVALRSKGYRFKLDHELDDSIFELRDEIIALLKWEKKDFSIKDYAWPRDYPTNFYYVKWTPSSTRARIWRGR